MIEDLKAFCIMYIVTPWVILFNANSKSIQNLKQKLIICNDFSSADKLLFTYIHHSSGPATPRGGGGRGIIDPPPSPTFLRSKKKKGEVKQKITIFKAETIERLSPRSKCYCSTHSRMPRIQKIFLSANHGGRQYFSVFHGPCTSKAISPALFFGYFVCTVQIQIVFC